MSRAMERGKSWKTGAPQGKNTDPSRDPSFTPLGKTPVPIRERGKGRGQLLKRSRGKKEDSEVTRTRIKGEKKTFTGTFSDRENALPSKKKKKGGRKKFGAASKGKGAKEKGGNFNFRARGGMEGASPFPEKGRWGVGIREKKRREEIFLHYYFVRRGGKGSRRLIPATVGSGEKGR